MPQGQRRLAVVAPTGFDVVFGTTSPTLIDPSSNQPRRPNPMSDDFDYFEHDENERDLLADAAQASWQAPDEWWRTFVAGLDVEQVAQLRAGRMSFTGWNGHGMVWAPVVAPSWLFEDPSPDEG
jgi:hypothetical protein